MSAVTTLPFRRLDGWTVDDLDELSDEDCQDLELVDGALLMTPPPVLQHSYASGQLLALMSPVVPAGHVALLEGGVQFDVRNWRKPDVVVIRRAALVQKYATPADVLLAVEVMSPGTVSTDRVAKPAQYAAAGIPAFWRLELDDRVLVTHVLDGDAYRETGRHTGVAVVEEPFRVELDVRDLLV